MIQSNYTVQILEAEENHKLTQKADVDILQRVFTNKVFLSINDDAKNWKEISDSEAELLQQKQREIAER
ncbi:hypothetical protein ACMSEZ_05340 [Bacteroides thetaiotaomicron]|uniref:hypothetical protein n=1 Tax=Bacteroides thetaiotaomicron TaxID=818 RepID=UPI0039C2E21D